MVIVSDAHSYVFGTKEDLDGTWFSTRSNPVYYNETFIEFCKMLIDSAYHKLLNFTLLLYQINIKFCNNYGVD